MDTFTGYWPNFRMAQDNQGLTAPTRKILNPVRLSLVSETLTTEPNSLADTKNFLRVTSTAEDQIITKLMVSKRRWLEKYLNIALVPKTINMWNNNVPELRFVYFPLNPITAVNNVYWYDLADGQNLFATSNYQVNLLDTVSSIFLEVGAIWPPATRLNDAWQINFTCGYNNVSTFTPEPIQEALFLLVDQSYHHRGMEMVTDDTLKMGHMVKSMIEPYRNPVTVL